VNLVKGLTRLTGLTNFAWSGELVFFLQMAVKQGYGIGFTQEMQLIGMAVVKLFKGFTRLKGVTELERSGEPAHTPPKIVKQEYSIRFAHVIEQAAIGFVNLVKGLTRLTGLTAAAVRMWSNTNYHKLSTNYN
ncbi:MAG: hypothetical protein IJS19_00505, partial [Muribaculaceae bacterium]|nr:hypothetical protein [Muribaculaceae bacterium]